jgi:hypothetical protein
MGLQLSSALMPAFQCRMSARTDEFDKMLCAALSKNANIKSRSLESMIAALPALI